MTKVKDAPMTNVFFLNSIGFRETVKIPEGEESYQYSSLHVRRIFLKNSGRVNNLAVLELTVIVSLPP